MCTETLQVQMFRKCEMKDRYQAELLLTKLPEGSSGKVLTNQLHLRVSYNAGLPVGLFVCFFDCPVCPPLDIFLLNSILLQKRLSKS